MIKEKNEHWANVDERVRDKKAIKKIKKYFKVSTVCNFLVLLFVVISFYVFVFSSFLEVDEISIHNNNSISSDKMINYLSLELEGRYWGVFSKRNYLFLNSGDLEKKIKHNFKKVKKVSAKKIFPNKISIHIEERNLILSLCSRGDCYFIDENGYAYEKADFNLSDVRENRTAKLIDESGKEIREGEYVLMPKYVDFIIRIEDAIKSGTSLEILNEYRTESRISEEVIVQTKKGWDIYLNSKFPIDKSIYTLKALLNRQIMLRDLNDLEYIDLRSENKVFYRMIGGVTQEEEELKKESEAGGDQEGDSLEVIKTEKKDNEN